MVQNVVVDNVPNIVPSLTVVVAILVGAAIFAYAITWFVKPLATWLTKDKRLKAWVVRLVSVVAGLLIGMALAVTMSTDLVWGITCGAGGGAMTTMAVAVKNAVIRRVGSINEDGS